MPEPQPQTFVAPARVNLIGEHTDYTGGLVLPMAVPFFTEATLSGSPDGQYRFRSASFPQERVLAPEDRGERNLEWSDYPVGVLREFQAKGDVPAPFSLSFEGDVPLGSGLSSSASIEVATAFALLSHMGKTMPPEAIAQLCQRAENRYVGSPCGIMDQTVIVLAEEGHALLLDTRSLRYEAVPLNRGAMADTAMVVCNSHVKHSIAAGEYGQRRREVEQGQAVVLKAYPELRDLGDASLDQLARVRDRMSPESFKRCHHIVSENARVRGMVAALEQGDAVTAGQLMLKAHESQRDDFQCSCDEIDYLVATAATLPGCYGARMTGGGFGGCTVNLVQKDAVEAFRRDLTAAYQRDLHIEAETFVFTPVDGALRRNAAALAAAQNNEQGNKEQR